MLLQRHRSQSGSTDLGSQMSRGLDASKLFASGRPILGRSIIALIENAVDRHRKLSCRSCEQESSACRRDWQSLPLGRPPLPELLRACLAQPLRNLGNTTQFSLRKATTSLCAEDSETKTSSLSLSAAQYHFSREAISDAGTPSATWWTAGARVRLETALASG